jgi:hypothetical protein
MARSARVELEEAARQRWFIRNLTGSDEYNEKHCYKCSQKRLNVAVMLVSAELCTMTWRMSDRDGW